MGLARRSRIGRWYLLLHGEQGVVGLPEERGEGWVPLQGLLVGRAPRHRHGWEGDLTDEEIIEGAEWRAYFSVGEVTMANILAGSIAVPAGYLFTGILRSCPPSSAGQSSSCPG